MSRGTSIPRFFKGINVSLILVIEDDPRIQKALHRQFTTEGYEVHVAGDGAPGLGNWKNFKPAGGGLDLMLPGVAVLGGFKGHQDWCVVTALVLCRAGSLGCSQRVLL